MRLWYIAAVSPSAGRDDVESGDGGRERQDGVVFRSLSRLVLRSGRVSRLLRDPACLDPPAAPEYPLADPASSRRFSPLPAVQRRSDARGDDRQAGVLNGGGARLPSARSRGMPFSLSRSSMD